MNAEQLLQHFNRITEAPDAIPRLRRFILDLAVRGKLVPQDHSDEPAAELLRWIKAEKDLLIAEGAFRREKPLPIVDDEAILFPTPDGWAWTRLGVITTIQQGFPFSSEYFGKDLPSALPLIKIGDIGSDASEVFTSEMQDPSYQVNPGDILLGLSGSIKCSIWNGPIGLLNQRIARIRPAIDELPKKWLFLAVNSCIDKWKEETSKLTVQNIKTGQLYGAVVALPPLAEQHRIVVRMDELMSLCDQLEAARAEREQTRDSLVAASLQGLSQPAEEEETFREHARFTFNSLPRITTRTTHIKQLRQTILNLAVRGKLVPQDPNDEPTAELLNRIAERKAQMMNRGANGGRRKKHRDIEIMDSEKYLALPDSWSWARLVELGLTQTGSSPSSANLDFFGDEIPFIKPGDLDGKEIFYDGQGLSFEGIKHSRLASSNTVLMVCIGATLGKVNTTTRPICFNQQINSLTPVKGVEASFVALALKSSEFQKLAWSKAGTGTLPIISKGKWEVLPIPLPPLEEQNRIIAKVDELLGICDQLETQITETEQDSRRFLEAVLNAALSPAPV